MKNILLLLHFILFATAAWAQTHTCYSKEVDYAAAQRLFTLQEKYEVSASEAQYISPKEPYEGHITLNAGEKAVVCIITEKEADQVQITISKPSGEEMKDVKMESPEHNVGVVYFTATEAGTYIITCTVLRKSGFHSCSTILSGKAL